MPESTRQITSRTYMTRDAGSLLVLTAAWMLLALIVDPRGDFPLLDDWSYGRSVKTLVEEGRLAYDGWNTPTLTLQVLWGALFALPFGFSFEALRVAALAAGLSGVLGTYVLLRQVDADRRLAMVGSLTVMVNPGYFQHSFAFMTDVPFTALVVWSTFFFVRALKANSDRDVGFGTLLACGAVLVRQPGIALPLGYALALLVTYGLGWRNLVRASLPAVAVVGVLVAHGRLLEHLQMTPAMAGAFDAAIASQLQGKGMFGLVWGAFTSLEASFAHMALFALPCLFLLFASDTWRWCSARANRPWTYVIVGLALLLVWWRLWSPDLPIRVFGMAHSVMHGPQPWTPINEPTAFRLAVWGTEIAATLLMLILVGVTAVRRYLGGVALAQEELARSVFGIGVVALLLVPFALAGGFNERYLIPTMPVVILLLATICRPVFEVQTPDRRIAGMAASVAVLAAFAAVSVVFAHDFLALNRARWDAINHLVRERGVDPARIDGGLTVNGWYLFPVAGPLRERYVNWKFEGVGWWRNDRADHIVGIDRPAVAWRRNDANETAPLADVRIVYSAAFQAWLPDTSRRIVVCIGTDCRKQFRGRE